MDISKPKEDDFDVLNLCIIVMKYCIYKAFLNNEKPKFYDFKLHIKQYIEAACLFDDCGNKWKDKINNIYNML